MFKHAPNRIHFNGQAAGNTDGTIASGFEPQSAEDAAQGPELVSLHNYAFLSRAEARDAVCNLLKPPAAGQRAQAVISGKEKSSWEN